MTLGALGLAAVAAGCGDDEGTGGRGGGAATSTTSSTGQGGAGGAGGGAPAGITIPGQTAAVKAVYDEHGLLHLACSTDEDCFASLGYFHAANRFFFMDFVRNLVRGTLGTLVKGGAIVLGRDYENRRFFTTSEGQPLEEKFYADASPAVRGYLDAYARGVNAWLGDMRAGKNGATLTTEYDFALIAKDAIRDWQPEDCTAVALYVLNDLSNNAGFELDLAERLPAFPPALAADIFSPRPVFDAFTSPAQPSTSLVAPRGEPRRALQDRLGDLSRLVGDAAERLHRVGSGARNMPVGNTGSNNWVLGPSRTANGSALLANDPHLALTNPSIWFPIEIDAKSSGGNGSYHVAGGTFPGLPSIMIGRNESIAWGVTVANWDIADVYVETLTDDNKSVMFNGNAVPIVEKEFTFADASTGGMQTKTFRWVPHHGPIISEDSAAHTAVSVRWRAHEGGTDLDVFFALGKASTTAEAKAGIELASSLSQNFVVIDRAGDIGWYPFTQVPKRPWASQALRPWLPLPGDGSAEWDSFVPFASLPQLTNPPSGAIATANGDMTGASADGDLLNDGQAALQTFLKADGTREQRILDLLADGADLHSVATMNAMQGDTHSLYGEFVVPIVLAAAQGAPLNADEQALVDTLSAWQFTCPTGLAGSDPATAPDSPDATLGRESIGCTAFHAVFAAIVEGALHDEITAFGLQLNGDEPAAVARFLRSPGTIASDELLWDDVSTPAVETRTDILRRAITFAAAHLAVTGGPNTWRWGRLHTLSLRSIYDSFGITSYNAPPVAAPGGLFTVNVANPRDPIPASAAPWSFNYSSGASMRIVVEASANGLAMTFQLPGGTDLHRESPFYNNLLPDYLDDKAIDFAFGPGAVKNPASTIDVKPAP